MKKVWGIITVSFIVLIASISFFSLKTEAATLKYAKVSEDKNGRVSGFDFNENVRRMVVGSKFNENYNGYKEDELITSVEFMSKGEQTTSAGTDLIAYLKSAGVTDFNATYAVYEDGRVYVIRKDDKIVFDESCECMFKSMSGMYWLNFGNNVDASNVRKISAMFQNCYNLVWLDWGSFSCSKITDMYALYSYCYNLTKADLTPFKGSKPSNLSFFCASCKCIKEFDLSVLDVSEVKDYEYLLGGCKRLEKVNLKGIDLSRVDSCNGMFKECRALKYLDVSGFNPVYATNFISMFYELGADCDNPVLKMDNFNAKKITLADFMFTDFKGNLDISALDFSGVVSCDHIFSSTKYSKFKAIKTPAKMPTIVRIPLNGTFYKSSDGGKTVDKSVAYTYLDKNTPTATWLYRDPNEVLPPDEEEESDETKETYERKEKSSDRVETANPVAVGTEFTIGKETYRVISEGIVELKKSTSKAKTVKIKSEVTFNKAKYRVNSIGQNAFAKNKKIKAVVIPSSVTSIGKGAFKGCKNLSKITFKSASVKSIGKGAFKGIKKGATIVIKGKDKKAAKKLRSKIILEKVRNQIVIAKHRQSLRMSIMLLLVSSDYG